MITRRPFFGILGFCCTRERERGGGSCFLGLIVSEDGVDMKEFVRIYRGVN